MLAVTKGRPNTFWGQYEREAHPSSKAIDAAAWIVMTRTWTWMYPQSQQHNHKQRKPHLTGCEVFFFFRPEDYEFLTTEKLNSLTQILRSFNVSSLLDYALCNFIPLHSVLLWIVMLFSNLFQRVRGYTNLETFLPKCMRLSFSPCMLPIPNTHAFRITSL